MFAILQKYDFSSKSQQTRHTLEQTACCLRYCKSTIFQANHNPHVKSLFLARVVCDTAKVRFFKQITTHDKVAFHLQLLFAILQKYDFSSKSQPSSKAATARLCCLRYCKSTIFQAKHNAFETNIGFNSLFAILQKYDFSSKSQPHYPSACTCTRCLRYCKSTIFQANHNLKRWVGLVIYVVCDTAKVRFFKQITTKILCKIHT